MTLLRIDDLTVTLSPERAARPILDRVSLDVSAGEIVGLVGESGSGKSTSARAAVGSFPAGASVGGSVVLADTDLVSASPQQIREIRRRKVAMVFQDPRAALNPVRRVGDFIAENLVLNLGRSRRESRALAVELLGSVGIHDPETVVRQYPHQLSGGMLQRAVIAAALTADPDLILADEATSALDVSTQAETLALLAGLRASRGLGVLLITHDLHLAAAFCDRVFVMYAGRVVEEQRGDRLFTHPTHPYTAALLACTPRLDGSTPVSAIGGQPLSLAEVQPGCGFAPRCAFAEDACRTAPPEPVHHEGAVTRCRRIQALSGILGRHEREAV